jgi:cellulose synthase/poly-beta-1,6-N-acetylglucosamine synthase-like glycosyltransferase
VPDGRAQGGSALRRDRLASLRRAEQRLDDLEQWLSRDGGLGAPPPPRPRPPRHAQRARWLDASINGLRRERPELSAASTFVRWQRRAVLGAVGVVVLLAILAPRLAGTLVVSVCVICYMASVLFRLRLFGLSLKADSSIEVTEDEARAVKDADLPVYTVMVPAYAEPEVVGRLLEAMGGLDYPRDKLDMKLLLEEDDAATVEAVERAGVPSWVDVVLVPAAQPRTKPKALNYGLFAARGEFLTIYDAEDRPDPLQLRRAVVALRRCAPEIACLQAQLAYFNPGQNMITRWFTLEYRMWFTQFLPGLACLGAPVPLGGTSNHFRTAVLRALGGWDPFNVTEDADLGLRLHRLGHRTGVLGSVTYEEANSDFVNWMKQRSRWYKGYLQTWLVHLRHPAESCRQLGWRQFLRFNLFVGGTPLLAVLNPVFWVMTLVWFVAHPGLIESWFPPIVYYPALLCLVVGNFLFLYAVLLTAVEADQEELTLWAALSMPVYWAMMSMAAVKAALQLVTAPSYWEKTTHGLDAPVADPAAGP